MATVVSGRAFIVDVEVAGFTSVAGVAVAVIAGPFPAAGRRASSAVSLSRAPRCQVIFGLARRISALRPAGSVNITVFLRARQGSCLYDFPFIRAESWRCHGTDHLVCVFLLSFSYCASPLSSLLSCFGMCCCVGSRKQVSALFVQLIE